MQSGIQPSSTLRTAFQSFTSNPSHFALPITIQNESLQALDPITFTSSSFASSLSSLEPHLQEKTPIYLILRSQPQAQQDKEDVRGTLIAVTYVPPTSPVRQKMLFASTRSTLTRDLGVEWFGGNVFATDPHEILDQKEWDRRSIPGTAGSSTSTGAGRINGSGNMDTNDDLLTREERELGGIRRAEDEARHGTAGRDLMGSAGSGGGLQMRVDPAAQRALQSFSSQTGTCVILGIDLSSETLTLLSESSESQPSGFLSKVRSQGPSYTFWSYPDTEEVVFLYTCPSASKVKEKMVYASARASVLAVAEGEGIRVTKRFEQGDVGDVDAQRVQRECVGAGVNDAGEVQTGNTNGSGVSSGGFSRPKRPGRR